MKPRGAIGASLLAVVLAAGLHGCAGSVIKSKWLTPGQPKFDFRESSCDPPQAARVASDDVEIRQLGSGGIFIGWGADALLLGPYFSRVGGVLAAQCGHVKFDEQRIDQGMTALDATRVRAILFGHSHFDHFGDIPIIARKWVPDVPIYTNDTGLNLLHPYPDVASRAKSMDAQNGPIDVPGAAIRIQPIRWRHAPQLCGCDHWPCTYARCETTAPVAAEWQKLRLKSLCDGTTFAYVIELLGPAKEVRFRIFYGDSAAPTGTWMPPSDPRPPGYDLAILCMASFDFVKGYPEWIIDALQPRHVVISHFEDFFTAKRTGGWTFVPLMTNAKADRFMEKLDAATKRITKVQSPSSGVCGPSTDRWSIPVPEPLRAIVFRPLGGQQK